MTTIEEIKKQKEFYIMTKDDIEKELSQIQEHFGMTPDEFYKAWRNDEIHGFHATKFGCLYEFYRDEFEHDEDKKKQKRSSPDSK